MSSFAATADREPGAAGSSGRPGRAAARPGARGRGRRRRHHGDGDEGIGAPADDLARRRQLGRARSARVGRHTAPFSAWVGAFDSTSPGSRTATRNVNTSSMAAPMRSSMAATSSPRGSPSRASVERLVGEGLDAAAEVDGRPEPVLGRANDRSRVTTKSRSGPSLAGDLGEHLLGLLGRAEGLATRIQVRPSSSRVGGWTSQPVAARSSSRSSSAMPGTRGGRRRRGGADRRRTPSRPRAPRRPRRSAPRTPSEQDQDQPEEGALTSS